VATQSVRNVHKCDVINTVVRMYAVRKSSYLAITAVSISFSATVVKSQILDNKSN